MPDQANKKQTTSPIGDCDVCGVSMRGTLIANTKFTDVMKALKTLYPGMSMSLKPRHGELLLCQDPLKAGHDPKKEPDDLSEFFEGFLLKRSSKNRKRQRRVKRLGSRGSERRYNTTLTAAG